MNVYLITLNLAASEHQTGLMQQIKSRGDDVIQTGSGLCAKTSLGEKEFGELVAATASEGIKIEKVSSGETDALPPDVKAFLGS